MILVILTSVICMLTQLSRSTFAVPAPPPSLKKFKVLPFLNIFPKEKVSRKKPPLTPKLIHFL